MYEKPTIKNETGLHPNLIPLRLGNIFWMEQQESVEDLQNPRLL